jgi:hypothetical protein
MSKSANTIILDTRSDSMFQSKHIKGAKHLNFSDFTQYNLDRLIPDSTTRILIYCNNNFYDDPIYFVTKSAKPKIPTNKPLTLALNIPAFINLYGYGFRNIYELSELVSVKDPRISMEGKNAVEFHFEKKFTNR